jgi:RsbT co-antagonist protein rsbRD N-terminal domain
MDNQGTDDYFFQTPVTKRLIELIEHHADDLTKSWLREVKKDPGTPTYAKYEDENELYKRAFLVFSQLGKWIAKTASKDDIEKYWTDLGRRRRKEGFPLSEIVQSLFLIRRHLWQKVEAEGLLDTAYDLFQAMELSNQVTLFFDRAVYHSARGFEAED